MDLALRNHVLGIQEQGDMILLVYPISIVIAAMAIFWLSPIGAGELRERIGTIQIYRYPAGTFYVSLLPSISLATAPFWLGDDAIALAVCGSFALLGLVGAYYTRQYRVIVNCHQVTVVGMTKQHFNMRDIAQMEMTDTKYSHGLRIRLYDGRRFYVANSIVEYDALVGILINAVKPAER